MVPRNKFNKEVKSFETYYQRPLELCLATTCIRQTFFKNKTINRYLARSSDQVAFGKKNPLLKGTHAEKKAAQNDYYELHIYKHLPDVIPFRSKGVNSAFFYNRKTPDRATAIFAHKFHSLNKQHHLIYVDDRVLDMAGVVGDLKKVLDNAHLTKYNAIFRIYSVTHKAHTTSLLVIMNQAYHSPLAAVSLNSEECNSFFKYLKNNFFTHQCYQIPFIQMDYCLQQASDDVNCVLYSLNFINALVSYLSELGHAQETLDMAEKTYVDHEQGIQLRNVLSHELKQFLPFYFDQSTGYPKSLETLREYHLRQRWDLGSESLALHL